MAFYNIHGNTFGTTSDSKSSGKYIWHEVKAVYPVGGTIALTSYNVGDVIPAGSMVALDMANNTAKIVKATDSADLTKVNGLLKEDIVIDAAAKSTTGAATATVVHSGEVYASRLAEEIPASVLAQLKNIIAIYEA